MEEEITEITLLEGQKKRSPSFWVNVVTLLVLVAIVFWAQKWVERWSPNALPAEAMDKGIILEDLESDQPMLESENVEVLRAEEKPSPESRKPKAENRGEKTESRKPKSVPSASINELDPYTSGGPQDLDRPENWNNYFPNRPKPATKKEKATASPPLPSERDQLIPFESE